jgi:hypothetical protein
MHIYITDKKEIRTIQLRVWENGGWSPDMFGDLADSIYNDYPISEEQREENPDASAAMTEADYRETVEWWEAEIARYNAHNSSSWFVENLDSDELKQEWEKGLEYRLFAD